MKVFGGTNAIVKRWKGTYPNIDTYIDDLLGFEGKYRGWQISPVNMGLSGTPPDKIIFTTDTETQVRHGDGSLTTHIHRDGHYFNHIVEYPAKTRDDWQRVKELWLDPADPQRFPADWQSYAKLFKGRDYPLQLTCGGVYGFARNMLGDEALCLTFYDDPELIQYIMETYIGVCIAIRKRMVCDVNYDLIECWEDMAYNGGSLISKRHFMQFLAPQYRRIRDFAGNAGIPIMQVDSDGYIMDLAGWMHEEGVNCIYPFEAQAGNSITDIRIRFPGLGCIGGLDTNCMSSGKPAMDEVLETPL